MRRLFRELTFQEVRNQNLRVMDPTAIAHCMEHNLPILVFNYRTDGNIERAVRGEDIGTRVTSLKRRRSNISTTKDTKGTKFESFAISSDSDASFS